MMFFKEYCRVKLNTDKYIKEGVTIGSIGYIIEIYKSNIIKYEVEFSNSKTGETIAQIVVSEDEITICEK
jgi:hypothetical protein